jgi:hypothetical protein
MKLCTTHSTSQFSILARSVQENHTVGSTKGIVMYYKPNRDQTETSITIRAARLEDADALRRVAQRDSRAVPEGELLVALVDGEARAAISLASGETIADPFHPTAELVGMLTLRVSRLCGEPRRSRGGLRRLHRATA